MIGRATLAAAAIWAMLLGSGAALAQTARATPRGEQLFAAKQCGHCHRAGAKTIGPPLEQLRQPQGAYELAGRLWNHAPAMFTALTAEGLRWPEITPAEMADLMTYMQADPARDAKADRRRGLHVLVAKGCLKCHALNQEGARDAPDLAERRSDYAPAAKWAAIVWGHTPRMTAKAMQRGILYPRFSGDEMVNLVSFLRSPDAAR
jgi:cytochrome c551/c552